MHSYLKLHPDDEAKIDALLVATRRIERRLEAMAIKDNVNMRDISDILRAVTVNASIAASAALALQAAQTHFADAQAQIENLKAQLAADALDPAQVQTLLDTVATSSAQLSAAILANTAPQPAVVEQPVLGAATAGVTVGTLASSNAPGTVAAPGEIQAASGLGNVPAVPVAAVDPAAPVAVVVDPVTGATGA